MIDTDPRLVRFMRQLEDRPAPDLRRLRDETGRIMRSIPTVRLGSSQMEDQRNHLGALRSRLVGIKFDLLREVQQLTHQRQLLVDHLYARYGHHLGLVKTERGRRALVNRALEPLNRRIHPIENVLELVELVMSDYDSRAFAFRDVVAASRRGDREL